MSPVCRSEKILFDFNFHKLCFEYVVLHLETSTLFGDKSSRFVPPRSRSRFEATLCRNCVWREHLISFSLAILFVRTATRRAPRRRRETKERRWWWGCNACAWRCSFGACAPSGVPRMNEPPAFLSAARNSEAYHRDAVPCKRNSIGTSLHRRKRKTETCEHFGIANPTRVN